MCMSQLISFVLADSSCEPRKESKNYKMKKIAHSVTRTHYLLLTRLALLAIYVTVPSLSAIKGRVVFIFQKSLNSTFHKPLQGSLWCIF